MKSNKVRYRRSFIGRYEYITPFGTQHRTNNQLLTLLCSGISNPEISDVSSSVEGRNEEGVDADDANDDDDDANEDKLKSQISIYIYIYIPSSEYSLLDLFPPSSKKKETRKGMESIRRTIQDNTIPLILFLTLFLFYFSS